MKLNCFHLSWPRVTWDMAGKSAIINYSLCDFKYCSDGICLAKKACEKKILRQEGPYEPPYVETGMCSGCSRCITACPAGAIQKQR